MGTWIGRTKNGEIERKMGNGKMDRQNEKWGDRKKKMDRQKEKWEDG